LNTFFVEAFDLCKEYCKISLQVSMVYQVLRIQRSRMFMMHIKSNEIFMD